MEVGLPPPGKPDFDNTALEGNHPVQGLDAHRVGDSSADLLIPRGLFDDDGDGLSEAASIRSGDDTCIYANGERDTGRHNRKRTHSSPRPLDKRQKTVTIDTTINSYVSPTLSATNTPNLHTQPPTTDSRLSMQQLFERVKFRRAACGGNDLFPHTTTSTSNSKPDKTHIISPDLPTEQCVLGTHSLLNQMSGNLVKERKAQAERENHLVERVESLENKVSTLQEHLADERREREGLQTSAGPDLKAMEQAFREMREEMERSREKVEQLEAWRTNLSGFFRG
ncbi:hypothetical protein BJY04DRAFT_180901 [Aspergillus karnatakaensis]|uniref:uncharacterized protein n=1 Tax=Aspergillus karnatakaensis TaxID=1810916 RepID=UPI003CCDB7C5